MSEVKVMEITPDRLQKMHELQLGILKEFDRICRKHNLKYTLVGGTLLGAVRHGGFIPWDDDIDVSMLRAEYNKFCEICKDELDPEKYFLQTMDTDPEYRLIYGRILLNGTKYVRAGQEHMKSRNGIFIDIIPRDGKSDIWILRYIQSKLGKLMRKTLHSPVGALRSPSKVARLGFKVLRKLPRTFPQKLLSIIQFLSFSDNTELVACYGLMANGERRKLEMGKKGYKEYIKKLKLETDEQKLERKERNRGLKRKYFENLIEMQFEDMTAMVTEYYDVWLKTNYNDYMELPPENQRKVHQTVSYYSFGPYEDE